MFDSPFYLPSDALGLEVKPQAQVYCMPFAALTFHRLVPLSAPYAFLVICNNVGRAPPVPPRAHAYPRLDPVPQIQLALYYVVPAKFPGVVTTRPAARRVGSLKVPPH